MRLPSKSFIFNLNFRNGDTPLHQAARGSKGETAEKLIYAGARLNIRNRQDTSNSNRNGQIPLHLAARERYRNNDIFPRVIDLLIQFSDNADFSIRDK